MDVHVHVHGHLLAALGVPEVGLRATPESNSKHSSVCANVQRISRYLDVLVQLLDEGHVLGERRLQA